MIRKSCRGIPSHRADVTSHVIIANAAMWEESGTGTQAEIRRPAISAS